MHSERFRERQRTVPQYLVETPRIVNFEVPRTEWSELGEMKVRGLSRPQQPASSNAASR